MWDILIIGGGPAGLTAAIYAARAGRRPLILDQGGGALERAERIENYFGFPDPISGAELLRRGREQALRLGAALRHDQALSLSWDGKFSVAAGKEIVSAQAVVLATGAARRTPALPGLQRLDGLGVSYCAVCDGFFCRGRDVAVLGSGSFALHEAGALLPLAASVTLLTNGAPAPAELPAGLQCDIRPLASLEGAHALESVRFQDGGSLSVARLFVALGVADSAALARQAGAFAENGKIITDDAMATNVPGLFAAGDCVGGLLQVSKAVSEGALAGLSAVRFVRQQTKS